MPSLREYGGRIVTVDGSRVVEMCDPNDNSGAVYQYRRAGNTLEARMLTEAGRLIADWTPRTPDELRQMQGVRGEYHPILSELGL